MPQEDEAARQFSEGFFKAIENVLGITRTEICLADEWKRSAPEAVRDIPSAEYLKDVSLVIFLHKPTAYH